MEDDSSTLI